jgi:transposase InsO family protein
VIANRLNRDFMASTPNQKWVDDITGIWIDEGWLYLAALVDIYLRTGVGLTLDGVRDEQLVENA